MKLGLIRPDRNAPTTDLKGDHREASWEQNRLLRITDLEDGSISTNHTYRLAVPAFLVSGGDDWSWATEHFGLARRIDTKVNAPSGRQLLANYMKRLGKISSVPSRIKFEEPRTKPVRRTRRRRTSTAKHRH